MRGNNSLVTVKRGTPQVFHDNHGHASFSTKATEQNQLKKQIHKILQYVRRSRQTDTNRWPSDIRNTWERATQCEKWNAHANMTMQTPTSWVSLIKNLQRAIRNIDHHVKQLIHSEYKERRKRVAAKLADDPAGGRQFRAVRESPARPIQFLVEDEGILHTDPMKTDSIMTKAWAEVYNGTDKSDEQVLQDFRVLYAQDMYREDEQPITDITVEELRDAFRHVKNNAAAPDAWEDVTHSKLTDNPPRWLSRMLNEIEKEMNGQRRSLKHKRLASPKKAEQVTTLSVLRVAHHVTDLQEMGFDEAQALGTMDSPMGIATDVRWGSGARSRASLVATLTWFGMLEKPTDPNDSKCS